MTVTVKTNDSLADARQPYIHPLLALALVLLVPPVAFVAFIAALLAIMS